MSPELDGGEGILARMYSRQQGLEPPKATSQPLFRTSPQGIVAKRVTNTVLSNSDAQIGTDISCSRRTYSAKFAQDVRNVRHNPLMWTKCLFLSTNLETRSSSKPSSLSMTILMSMRIFCIA